MGIGWSEALATGVDEIDAQHRDLLRHVEALRRALRDDPAAVSRLLDYLGDYAVSHFATEERLMARHAYPGAEVHAAAHAGFLRAFARLRHDHELEGLTEGLAELIGSWLGDWLEDHIVGMDQELGTWLSRRGVRPDGPGAGGTWVVPSEGLLRVLSVTPGAGLASAGVGPGDLILALGGRRVSELGLDRAVTRLAAPGEGGLTVTVHPGGDRSRIETRFVPRRPARA